MASSGLIIVPNYMPALDDNGAPISGAKMYVYQNNTTTPATVYSDAFLLTPHANPVVADSAGRFPAIYADASAIYTVAFTTATGAPLSNGTYTDVGASSPSRGAKGDPGASATAIGLASEVSGINIPVGTDQVRTSGYSIKGVGAAHYAIFAENDAAALALGWVAPNGTWVLRANNGRWFRLDEPFPYVDMFGAIGDYDHATGGAGATDNAAAFEAGADYLKANFAYGGGIGFGIGFKIAGELVVPIGNFYTTKATNLTADATSPYRGMGIRGVSMYQSVIVANLSEAWPVIDATGHVGPTFRNFSITHLSTCLSLCGIMHAQVPGQVQQGNGLIIERVVVSHAGNPVNMVSSVVAVQSDQAEFTSLRVYHGLHTGTWQPTKHYCNVLAWGANTIKLTADVSADHANCIGKLIFIADGTGHSQLRRITGYGDVLAGQFTVDTNWDTQPSYDTFVNILSVSSKWQYCQSFDGNHTYSVFTNCWLAGPYGGLTVRGGKQYHFNGGYIAGAGVGDNVAYSVDIQTIISPYEDQRAQSFTGMVYTENQGTNTTFATWNNNRWNTQFYIKGDFEQGAANPAYVFNTGGYTGHSFAYANNGGTGTIGLASADLSMLSIASGRTFVFQWTGADYTAKQYDIAGAVVATYANVAAGSNVSVGGGTIHVDLGGTPSVNDKYVVRVFWGNISQIGSLNGQSGSVNCVLANSPTKIRKIEGAFLCEAGPGPIAGVGNLIFDWRGANLLPLPGLDALWNTFIGSGAVDYAMTPSGFHP